MARSDFGEVVDTMQDLQSESDHWVLAEKLLQAVPYGSPADWFDDIVDKASSAGIRKRGLTNPDTLRFYRKTAKLWPRKERVPNVSFTAHREAESLKGADGKIASASVRRAFLEDLVKKHGAADVTVTTVRRAVRAANGPSSRTRTTTPSRGSRGASASAATPPAGTVAVDILADLMSGGKKLIAAIGTGHSSSDLTKLDKGLDAVKAHVAQQASKRKAKKAVPAKKAAPKAQPASNGKTFKRPRARDL